MPDELLSLVNYESILEARDRIQGHVHNTAVVTSRAFNQLSGALVFFKCENLQRTGSFKVRGAHNAVLSLSETGPSRVLLHIRQEITPQHSL